MNKSANIDPIILGHNQFFGVDHLSSQKGIMREIQFSKIENILKIIKFSMNEDVNALMLSTHPRAELICKELNNDKEMKNNLALYPVLPYIAKYVRQANEKGIPNMVLDGLSNASIFQKATAFFKGGTGFIRKDIYKMLEVLIDMELLIFKGLKVKSIFLHQALTDLALGLDLKDIFYFYYEYIEKQFNAIPAFCTYNLPYLIKKFKEYGLENPVVMSSFNKQGFLMSPDLKSNENCLNNEKLDLVAMGTLASGYVKPKEAYEYLYNFKNISSTVVGVSTEEHARETFNIIKSYLN